MVQETIDHNTLARLVEAGVVHGAHIVGQRGGWAITVKYGLHERSLAAQRSRQVRLFRRFETLVGYLRGVGIAHFDVDAAGFEPAPVETLRRPDRAEALKHAHEVAAYDKWFREQVQASLDDPRPNVSDEEARAHFAARRAALRQRAQ